MIKVRFGLALDGARTFEPGNRLGEPVLGLLGFLTRASQQTPGVVRH